MFVFAQKLRVCSESDREGHMAHPAVYGLDDIPKEHHRRECPRCGYWTVYPYQAPDTNRSRVRRGRTPYKPDVEEWMRVQSYPSVANTRLAEDGVWEAGYLCQACGRAESVAFKLNPETGVSTLVGES